MPTPTPSPQPASPRARASDSLRSPRFAPFLAAVFLAAMTTLGGACETYDPPPEPSLYVPSDGQWTSETPLTVLFTEPIRPETLSITLWPWALDAEGDLIAGTEPLVADCTIATSPCGAVSVAVSDDHTEATITYGDLFAGKEGRPFILALAPGLTDEGGKVLHHGERFKFQVNPAAQGDAVDLTLNSGVIALFADMSDTLAGVYLRLFMDIGVDPADGTVWIAGTVAQPDEDQAPNATDPTLIHLYGDHRAWTIYAEGSVSEVEPGRFFLRLDPFDMHIKVLGVIDLQMNDFKLEMTIWPGAGEGGRDKVEGFVTASAVIMGLGEDATDLGGATAPIVAYGLSPDEIPTDLPRLCSEHPCDVMDKEGGDCQLPRPWSPGPSCPADQTTSAP